MKKILTQQPHTPWISIFIVLVPWLSFEMHTQFSSSAVVFSLKKFTDSPALIGLIGSSNQGFGLLVGSIVSLISDRIWTRMGRRRPFLCLAYFASAPLLFLLPHLDFFWGFVFGLVLYQAIYDLSAPLEPLTMEVVPSPQRGRAGAFRQWFQTGGYILLFSVLIAQFDATYTLFGGLEISGETVLYSVIGVTVLLSGMIHFFFVEEVRPADAEAYRLREIPILEMLKGLFTRELLPLFGLAYVMLNLWISLAQFEPLLITEQWGYSKSEFGRIMSYGMLITVVVAPFAGWVSDRFDRLTLLKLGLAMVLGLKAAFYLYAEYLAPGGIPPFYTVIVMGLIRGGITTFVSVATIPLIFDYASPNRLGALSCGMGIVFSLTSFIQQNSMGVWVTFSSRWLYDLPEGTYNYMAAYHYLFVMGLVGIGYLYLFSHWDRTGFVKRRGDTRSPDKT
jgi:Na+/melibiose symporter-like transporter